MLFFIGRPLLTRPFVRVYESHEFLLYFFCNVSHVLFLLFGWFVRWEANGRTEAIFGGVASWICSRQHVALLCSSHLGFSFWVLLLSMWCIHIVVVDKAIAWKKPCFLRIVTWSFNCLQWIIICNQKPHCWANKWLLFDFKNFLKP